MSAPPCCLLYALLLLLIRASDDCPAPLSLALDAHCKLHSDDSTAFTVACVAAHYADGSPLDALTVPIENAALTPASEPADGCAAPRDGAQEGVAAAVRLVARGNCSFLEKA